MFLQQKVHLKPILGNLGILLHVPAFMALASIPVCLLMGEVNSIFPFLIVFTCAFLLGKYLYKTFYVPGTLHLWDAMLIAAIGWLICSICGAFPLYYIGKVYHVEEMTLPLNALFESFSGFTSTGLTMISKPSEMPALMQWWRSLMQWVGGLGLVVFILSLTHLSKGGTWLYYAEARGEKLSDTTLGTSRMILKIYAVFTAITIALFWTFGMSFWEAINHAFTVVSTGGFSVSDTNFHDYGGALKLIALVMMILCAMSFALHFKAFSERKYSLLWKDKQQRLLYGFLGGGMLLILFLTVHNMPHPAWLDTFFEWTSALTTCGFNTVHTSQFSLTIRLLLIFAMITGGAAGSTCGGLKLQRVNYLFSGVFLRLKTITQDKEDSIGRALEESKGVSTEEPPGVCLPCSDKSDRVCAAGVLFYLWIMTISIGWVLLLRFIPGVHPIDALFETISAMSNVGLSTGITSAQLTDVPKAVIIFLMWFGRLEVVPFLILCASLPLPFKRPS